MCHIDAAAARPPEGSLDPCRKCIDICETLVDREEEELLAALSQTEIATLRKLLARIIKRHGTEEEDAVSDLPLRNIAGKN